MTDSIFTRAEREALKKISLMRPEKAHDYQVVHLAKELLTFDLLQQSKGRTRVKAE